MPPDPLETYRKKRDFGKTAEPSGERASPGREPIFVIQEHAASHHHFDVRLEIDGVLKSWAVPKGPSTNPRDKRLAVPTEDHPLDYARFEGHIPPGEYGGGSVIVWDTGTWEHVTEGMTPAEALANGHLVAVLHGAKLQGAWTFHQLRDRAWLLIKRRDEHADPDRDPSNRERTSVISGRTLLELQGEAPGETEARP